VPSRCILVGGFAIGARVSLLRQHSAEREMPTSAYTRSMPGYSAPQCSHCKRCTSYGNSVYLSVRPSVRPSDTRRYCVKTTACSTVQFAPSDSKMCLVLQKPKIFTMDDLFPLKSWLQVTYPLLKAASFHAFCLVATQPEEIEKEVQYT